MRAPGPRAAGSCLRGLLARLLRCAAGVSAVEFAVVAPVLIFGTLATADVGMAVYERMMINQVLRAGAQPALRGAEESVVLSALEEAARENFTVTAGEPTADEIALDVESRCACPGQTGVGIGCLTVCSSGTVAFRFYRLWAGKTYQGVLLPEFTFSASLEVMQQ